MRCSTKNELVYSPQSLTPMRKRISTLCYSSRFKFCKVWIKPMCDCRCIYRHDVSVLAQGWLDHRRRRPDVQTERRHGARACYETWRLPHLRSGDWFCSWCAWYNMLCCCNVASHMAFAWCSRDKRMAAGVTQLLLFRPNSRCWT